MIFLNMFMNINYRLFRKRFISKRGTLKSDVKKYCATNGSKEHAINNMKKIGYKRFI